MHPGPKCVDYSVNVVKEDIAQTLNTDAHLRSCLMGRSESIPIVDGKVELEDLVGFDSGTSMLERVQGRARFVFKVVGD